MNPADISLALLFYLLGFATGPVIIVAATWVRGKFK